MGESLDFFPFNMSPGPEFLVVYAALVAVVYFLGASIRARLAPRFIDHPLDETPTLWAADGGPYRTAAKGAVSQPLRRGVIPVGEQLYAVAELRAGRAAVANLIVAMAVGERWLSPTKKGHFRFDRKGKPATSLTRQLFDRLHGRGLLMNADVVKSDAKTVAKAAKLQPELVAAGLIRSTRGEYQWIAMGLVPVALVLAIGCARISWLAELGRPFSNLIFAMMIASFVGVAVARHNHDKSTSKSEYLGWLDDATISLRDDVRSGRRLDHSDVALALTVGGAAVLAGEAFNGVAAALVDDSPILYATASSWGSGSSWSGCGSFGGGGGCGGGGCGGGGGCS